MKNKPCGMLFAKPYFLVVGNKCASVTLPPPPISRLGETEVKTHATQSFFGKSTEGAHSPGN